MIIVCDVDDVVNDLMSKTVALYNKRFGRHIELEDITAYNFYDCLPEEVSSNILSMFKDKELWDSLEPVYNAQWGIETLINMGHKVVFATATHECNFEWKCKWIAEHFPAVGSSGVIRIKDKSLLRADIMIDDCMENLINNPCERICFDKPWNRLPNKDYVYDIYRARNWKEIIKFINEIERKMKEWEK